MPNAADIQQELLRLVRGRDAETSGASVSPAARTVAPPTVASPNTPEAAGADAVTELARELESLRRQLGASDEIARRQADILEQNTRAVLEGNTRAATGAGDTAREAVSSLRGSGGLGASSSPLAGLVSWLIRRRGGESTPEPELPRVFQPEPINANLGISGDSGLTPVSYRADGVPRTNPVPAPVTPGNITIQVQTMDSRSFLDNSDRIAQAVREAMLNSHAINDVIGEM